MALRWISVLHVNLGKHSTLTSSIPITTYPYQQLGFISTTIHIYINSLYPPIRWTPLSFLLNLKTFRQTSASFLASFQMCIYWGPKYIKCQHPGDSGYTRYFCYLARKRRSCEEEVKYFRRRGLCPPCTEEERDRRLVDALRGAWKEWGDEEWKVVMNHGRLRWNLQNVWLHMRSLLPWSGL